MKKKYDLTEGNILYKLTLLSLPIMGMSLIQMAYNMIDMIWIGRLGSGAVAGVGTAGFFLKFGFALSSIIFIGTGVRTSQAVGSKDLKKANSYAETSIINTIILITLFIVFILVAKTSLIDFFNLNNPEIEKMALDYMTITAFGIFFSALSLVFTRIFNGHGDSKTPFYITSIGLILNIALDPILIFGLFGIPKLGVVGAAIATVIAQTIVSTILFIHLRKKYKIFTDGFHYDKEKTKDIMKLGIPVATQRVLFTGFSVIIARIIAHWGADAIAVQRVGVQIESLSWITAGGFQGALAAFVGQNYGAKKYHRIKKGYFNAIGIISVLGIFVSFILIVFPEPIFKIFLQEESIVKLGADYLRILGVSQLFMVVEMTTVGGFQGIGKTLPPSIVSIILTGARIPMALLLSATALGLDGIWWSISISSIFKGIVLPIWFLIYLKKFNDNKKYS
ncbi:MAG: MATE family efflux transporter [Fusobacteria bacterium]|nr:MAG: MATE family efflux transporter [Fusobacteriota bacterium]